MCCINLCGLNLLPGNVHVYGVLRYQVLIDKLFRMFEAMSGNFAYSGDIHLFINVLSG